MKKLIVKIVTLCLCLMMLSSCSSKNSIVGTWNGITTYVFNSDGTGTAGIGDTVLNEFTYEIKDSKLYISYGTENFIQTDEFFFKIEDNKLYLGIDNSGNWLIYEKEKTSSKPETSNSAKASELNAEQLKEIVLGVFEADDWLIGGNSHVNWDNTTDINGNTYFKIESDKMHSTEDVYNFISQYYVASIVEEFKNSNMIVDYDGGIYSGTGGIGGLPLHVQFVKATKDGDTYSLLYHFDDPYGFGTGESEGSKILVNDNGRWVFAERCDSIMYDYADCEFIIE